MKTKHKIKNENKQELPANIIKYGLSILWVLALVFGLGFKMWFFFFIALFLTILYLSGGKSNGYFDRNSRHNFDNAQLNPVNPNGLNMRQTRSNNYRY